ncbi:hypothetical protein [Rudaea sp.]|uniref:hypothetical protein n=1 Tax=Rudaea sp. TaxID=2136325 RepID=UPI0032202C0D
MDAPDTVLAAFSRLLPRIAEEGGEAETIAETALARSLAKAAEISQAQADIAVALVRRWLQALAMLEPRRLAEGEWAFVSFPAHLLARSLLNGLGTPNFRLLEPGFWDSSDYRVDKQRILLKQAEELRATQPPGLVPIRRVWVAWTWLALDGRFLLVRREDPVQHRAGSKGQFVFPGGKVSPQDLPDLPLSARLDFFDPNQPANADIAAHAFRAALLREIHEELDIQPSDLAATTTVLAPIRYVALEGAKSTFSATEYWIQPFKLKLSDAGKTALLCCLAAYPERFDWFTSDELATGTNADGAKAFVDAINNAPPLDAGNFAVSIGLAKPFRDAITFPGTIEEPFAVGITGRERPVRVALSVDEVATLNWFAAVRRHEPVAQLADGISVASCSGWVLVDNDDLFARLKLLSARLDEGGLSLLDFHERAVRLNVSEEVHYSPFLMSLGVDDEKRGKAFKLMLHRREIHSPLGTAAEHRVTASLPEKLGIAIYSLMHGDPGPALDDFDTVKRMQRDIRATLDDIGLRVLIRQVDGVPELTVRPK